MDTCPRRYDDTQGELGHENKLIHLFLSKDSKRHSDEVIDTGKPMVNHVVVVLSLIPRNKVCMFFNNICSLGKPCWLPSPTAQVCSQRHLRWLQLVKYSTF